MNKILIIVVLIISNILFGLSHNDVELDTRIIGGEAARIEQLPYIVYLSENNIFTCGGALIRKRYVVTAAHCVVGVSRKSLTVTGGSSVLNERGVVRRVTRVMIPSSFNFRTLNMDIAVLKLSSKMTGDNIKPIKLCSHYLRSNEAARISGWGLTSPNGVSSANRLRTTIIRLYSRSKCSRSLRNVATLTKSMVCGDVPGIRDSCSGDSGGPLVSKGELCGVVSWGISCAVQGRPGVYTSINAARKFILKALKR